MSEQKSESTSKQKLSKLVLKSVFELGIKILVQAFHLGISKITLGSFFNSKPFAHKIQWDLEPFSAEVRPNRRTGWAELANFRSCRKNRISECEVLCVSGWTETGFLNTVFGGVFVGGAEDARRREDPDGWHLAADHPAGPPRLTTLETARQ